MMAQFPQFQPLSFEQANPLIAGLLQGQKFGQSMQQFPLEQEKLNLANIIAGVNAKYAEPMAEQGLIGVQQQNQYNPQLWQQQMALQKAQAENLGTEADINRFKLKNPTYISPEAALINSVMQNQNKYSSYTPEYNPYSNASEQTSNQGNMINANAPNNVQNINPSALAFNPPQMNSPTGNPTLDVMYYKKFGMNPVQQQQLEISGQQANAYQGEIIKRNAENNIQVSFANQSNLDAQKFLNDFDKLSWYEHGKLGGYMPAFSDAAQAVDASSAALVSSASKLFQGQNVVHAADIELQSMTKPDRFKSKDVAFDLAQGILAKNDRMKEKQQFYAQASQLKLKPEVMDALWNQFETDRPYFDVYSKMPNDAYKGTWRDYLKPQAINSIVEGKNYKPDNEAVLRNMNFNEGDIKKIKDWSKEQGLSRKGFSKQDLIYTAKKRNMTLPQLKMEFLKRGAFNAD